MQFKQITNNQGTIDIDLPQLQQVDQFSVQSLLIVEKFIIDKGIKNIFDFSCYEREKDEKRQVVFKTQENSHFDF